MASELQRGFMFVVVGQIQSAVKPDALQISPDGWRICCEPEDAWQMLKPGGVIGFVDFYVSRKAIAKGHQRHRAGTRAFGPLWFGRDNVWLNRDHLPYLQQRFETFTIHGCNGKLPYLPFVRVPDYRFAGRKAA